MVTTIFKYNPDFSSRRRVYRFQVMSYKYQRDRHVDLILCMYSVLMHCSEQEQRDSLLIFCIAGRSHSEHLRLVTLGYFNDDVSLDAKLSHHDTRRSCFELGFTSKTSTWILLADLLQTILSVLFYLYLVATKYDILKHDNKKEK